MPTVIIMAKSKREVTVDLSLGAPRATIRKTKEFSLIPVPPIDIGSIAMVETTGTMNIKEVKDRSIPSAFAARK